MIRYTLKRTTRRRTELVLDRTNFFPVNRLNSEQFNIAATLTVEEIREHRKIQKERRDLEIERMERILTN